MKPLKYFIPVIMLVFLLPLLTQAQWLRRQQNMKTVREARGLALTNTILPVATGIGAAYLFENKTVQKIGASLAVYGLIMGPSDGNFYAEDYLRGGLGAIARAGSGYLLIDATRELMGDQVAEPLGWDNKSVKLTDTKVLVGAGIFLTSMVYNFVSARASVNAYNQNLGYTLYLAPQQIGDESVPMLTAKFRF